VESTDADPAAPTITVLVKLITVGRNLGKQRIVNTRPATAATLALRLGGQFVNQFDSIVGTV
jgi:hypothetical protein